MGGIQKLLVTTASVLNRDFFDITVCSIGSDVTLAKELEDLGVKIIALGRRCKIYNILIAGDLFDIIRTTKPHIVHTHSFYSNFHGRLAAFFLGVPCIVASEHGTYSSRKGLRHRLLDLCLSAVSDRVIAVSRAVKNFLVQEEHIPEKKISVIYNTLDFTKMVSRDRAVARKEFQWEASAVLLGHVGTYTPTKGQDIAIEVMNRIVRDIPQACLILVGADPVRYRKVLSERVRELGLTGKVQFFDRVDDMTLFLSALDLFLFPSATEGFGLAVLEAAAMGVPVVAYATEGIQEIFEDTRGVYLVSERSPEAISHATKTVIYNIEQARVDALLVKEHVREKFAPGIFAGQLEKLYTDILTAKGVAVLPKESVSRSEPALTQTFTRKPS